MAKKTTEDDDPKAPGGAALAEDEYVEVSVVDEEDTELLTVEPATEGAPDPEVAEPSAGKAATKADARLPATPAKETAPPPTRPLTPIERRERDKRKEYARKWQQSVEEQDRLRARLDEVTREVSPTRVKLSEERLRAIREQADKATDLGVVAEVSVKEAARLMEERDQQWTQRLNELQLVTRIQLSWLGAQLRHRDFLDVVEQSGVSRAIGQRADGSFENPYLARRVYGALDPGEEVYQLAVGRLEHEGTPTNGEVQEPETDAPGRAPKSATQAKQDEDREAEAERRGAREVVDKVVKNAQRPKGIAGLTPAGAVKTRWSREELDQLMRRNPVRYEELIRRFPELERYHLS